MNQDAEHLRLLSIFHYIVAGLAAFFSFFPLFYMTVGAIFTFVTRHGTARPVPSIAWKPWCLDLGAAV